MNEPTPCVLQPWLRAPAALAHLGVVAAFAILAGMHSYLAFHVVPAHIDRAALDTYLSVPPEPRAGFGAGAVEIATLAVHAAALGYQR